MAISVERLRLLCAGMACGIALSWIVEAFLVGRGVVSTYLAPLCLVLLAASLLFHLWSRALNHD